MVTYVQSSMVDREAFEAFVKSSFMQTKKMGSNVLTRSRGAQIVAYLVGESDGGKTSALTSAHFKLWVKSRGFRLMDYPVLGLSNVLCLPAKPQKKVYYAVQKMLCTIDFSCLGLTLLGKYRRVAFAEDFYGILNRIHCLERNHTGCKKTLAEVSTVQIFVCKLTFTCCYAQKILGYHKNKLLQLFGH